MTRDDGPFATVWHQRDINKFSRDLTRSTFLLYFLAETGLDLVLPLALRAKDSATDYYSRELNAA